MKVQVNTSDIWKNVVYTVDTDDYTTRPIKGSEIIDYEQIIWNIWSDIFTNRDGREVEDINVSQNEKRDFKIYKAEDYDETYNLLNGHNVENIIDHDLNNAFGEELATRIPLFVGKIEIEPIFTKMNIAYPDKCCDMRYDSNKDSCGIKTIIVHGEKYTRKPGYSHDDDRCDNCNIINAEGNYHHIGCESETCPSCDDKATTCDCHWEY